MDGRICAGGYSFLIKPLYPVFFRLSKTWFVGYPSTSELDALDSLTTTLASYCLLQYGRSVTYSDTSQYTERMSDQFPAILASSTYQSCTVLC